MRSPELEATYKEEKREETKEELKRRKLLGNQAEDTESGYSETKQAHTIEGYQKDLYALKNNKNFTGFSDSRKIVASYKVVSNKLKELLEEYLQLVEKDLHRAQKMHEEIKRIRAMQKVLLTKLFGKLDEGEFNEEGLEKELEEILGS